MGFGSGSPRETLLRQQTVDARQHREPWQLDIRCTYTSTGICAANTGAACVCVKRAPSDVPLRCDVRQ